VPAAHTVHSPPSVDVVPFRQFEHALDPSEDLPAAHAVHSVAPEAPYVPAAHATHVRSTFL